MKLNIDNSDIVKFTNKLEKMHRSGLPFAVRNTLNKTGLDAKKNSLPRVVNKEFTQRNKTFFKVISGVKFASGYDVKNMTTTFGILNFRNVKAAKSLDKQEFGGSIGGRSFIPTIQARVGNKKSGKVKKKYALSNFKNMPIIGWKNKKNFRRKTKKLKVGKAFVYGNSVLFIKSFKQRKGQRYFNSEFIYTYEKNRSAKIKKATHFLRKSAEMSAKKMERIYKTEAEKQIKRLTK